MLAVVAVPAPAPNLHVVVVIVHGSVGARAAETAESVQKTGKGATSPSNTIQFELFHLSIQSSDDRTHLFFYRVSFWGDLISLTLISIIKGIKSA